MSVSAGEFLKWLEVFNVQYGGHPSGGTVLPGLINQIAYYPATGDSIDGLATTAGGVLITNAGGEPSMLPNPTATGRYLQSVSGAASIWSTVGFPVSVGATGTLLRSDGTNWAATTTTYPNTNAINTLLYASSANVMAALATANNGMLVTSAGGVPSIGNAVLADITINGVSAGLGGGSVATNTIFGLSAIAGAATGTQNAAFGYQAMNAISSGDNSTAVGYQALKTASTSVKNTAVGSFALNLVSTGSGLNTGCGQNAGAAITTGSANTCVGQGAGQSNQTGTHNTAIGTTSMLGVASNSHTDNTGVGYQSLYYITTGARNTVMGVDAGINNASGSVAITSGTDNTLLGYRASTNSATAVGTVAIGANAVATIATGATSADHGPGIAIGSAGNLVGFRGDGTIYPSTTGAGFWRPAINGTKYMIPLITDGATAWPAITTSSITFSSTSGIIGTTTNNSAAAGSVGELISSVILASGSLVSLTANTSTDVTSISLTAGDWDVWGNVGFTGQGATVVSSVQGWVSSSSSTQPDAALQTILGWVPGAALYTIIAVGLPVAPLRFSLSGTTTIYLGCRSSFTTGTTSVYGGIYARRKR